MKLFTFRQFLLVPNLLSILRIILAIPIVLLLTAPESKNDFYLIILLIAAAATDYLDGFLSRKMNQVTELGKMLDPIADKLAMGAILISMIYFRDFPVLLVILLVYRDLMIVVFGFFVTKKTSKATSANFLGKLNTTIVAITMLLFFLVPGTIIFTIFYFLSLISIIVSGVNYYFVGERSLFIIKRTRWIVRIILIIVSYLVISMVNSSQALKPGANKSTSVISLENSEELIRKYSPIFYFSKDEKFFPINVESFFDHALLFKSNPLLLFDKELDDRINQHSFNQQIVEQTYLKLNRNLTDNISELYSSVKSRYPVVVYGRTMEVNEDGKSNTIIQYWLFYWASNLGSYDIVWHECDWEVVMYKLDENLVPIEAGYSQHYYGEVKKWGEVELINGRPVAYISKGGHSMYFNKGEHSSFLDNSKKIQLGTDYCSSDIKLDPGEYKIEILQDTTGWINYKGYWGLPLTTKLSGPKFRNPNNQELSMWTNPIGWFEKYRM